MRDKRADAAHFRPEGFDELQILRQFPGSLEWRAHHEARPHGISDLPELPEAVHPMAEGHPFRVKLPVMAFVRRLMPEQIPVGAGVEQCLVAGSLPLSDGKGDCAFRIFPPDLPDQRHQHFVGEISVFSALEHEGPVSQFIALCAAVQNLLLCEPVPLHVFVAIPDTAVEAVIPAYIGEFDESADEDLIAVDLLRHPAGLPGQPVPDFLPVIDQIPVLFLFQGMLPDQFPGDPLQFLFHFFPFLSASQNTAAKKHEHPTARTMGSSCVLVIGALQRKVA